MRKLIKAREGVYGRQATPEERKILQEFAREWVRNNPRQAAENRADAQLKKSQKS